MEDIIGKKMMHSRLGKVKVLSRKERSRTMFTVKQIDRGRGWDKELKKYVGYSWKTPTGKGWARGENYEYGKEQEVHINELTKLR